MERFLLRPDRLPQLPLLLGVVDIKMLGGTPSFEGVFAVAGDPEDKVEVNEFSTPSFEGAAAGRPVVFKFTVEEDPMDEVEDGRGRSRRSGLDQ